jgi:hypothetical protein
VSQHGRPLGDALAVFGLANMGPSRTLDEYNEGEYAYMLHARVGFGEELLRLCSNCGLIPCRRENARVVNALVAPALVHKQASGVASRHDSPPSMCSMCLNVPRSHPQPPLCRPITLPRCL